MKYTMAILAWTLVTAMTAVQGAEWYVSPMGTADGDGSEAKPWNLDTALAHPKAVKPGDTVWVMEGKYVAPYRSMKTKYAGKNHVYFYSKLTGTRDKPVVLRAAPGARVTVMGDTKTYLANRPSDRHHEPAALTIAGDHSWVWGVEACLERAQRVSAFGRGGGDVGGGLNVWADHVKLINVVIHDCRGFGLLNTAPNSELYGSLVFYNGVFSGAGPIAHGAYIQTRRGDPNDRGRTVVDSFIFDNMEYGIHGYTSGGAELRGFTIEGNTIFNTGYLQFPAGRPVQRSRGYINCAPNIYLGSSAVGVEDSVIRHNVCYYPKGATGRNLLIGGLGPGCKNVILSDNYIVGGSALLFGPRTKKSPPKQSGNVAVWYDKALDTNATFIRPNRYERGRANITIVNWEKRKTVTVDLSGVKLKEGEAYEVRDVQNFFGPPVARGLYGKEHATVTLPMEGLTRSQPNSDNLRKDIPHTAPRLGTFVVMRRPD